MSDIKKLNQNDESKVAGGAIIGGEQKVLLEESEIKKYEYICNSCGKVSYNSGSLTCPHCRSFFNYSKTGTVLFDYDYASGATWRSVQDQDT